jgi:hypothetical protein
MTHGQAGAASYHSGMEIAGAPGAEPEVSPWAGRRKTAASTILVLLLAIGGIAGYRWYESRDVATMRVGPFCPGTPQFGLEGYVTFHGRSYGVQGPPWSHAVRGTVKQITDPVTGQPSVQFVHDGTSVLLGNPMHSCPIS